MMNYRKYIAPLTGLAIFACATGYLLTLMPLLMQSVGHGTMFIGVSTSVYYLGLLAGSFRTENLVAYVGHIRSFAGFIALLGASILLISLIESRNVWIVLRFINGFCIAGIYVVIESWLLADSTRENRGKLLSIYMVSLYGASALGQLLISYFDTNTFIPFVIIGIMMFLSIIPPVLINLPAPELHSPSKHSMITLFMLTPSGMICALVSGVILASILGLLPLYLEIKGLPSSNIGYVMFSLIAGGMLLQYPVGRLSDYFDRRKILLAIGILGIIPGIIIVFLNEQFWLLIGMFLILGGSIFTLYPVSISHACDHFETKDLIAGCQALLFSYSIGSCAGPIIASFFMNLFRHGLIFFYMGCLVFIVIFLAIRVFQREPSSEEEHHDFIPVTNTSPVATEMDPRADE